MIFTGPPARALADGESKDHLCRTPPVAPLLTEKACAKSVDLLCHSCGHGGGCIKMHPTRLLFRSKRQGNCNRALFGANWPPEAASCR